MNMNDNNLTNITKHSFFKSYLTNFNLKIYKYSLLKMLKSVGGGIYIFLLTFIAFILPGMLLILRTFDLSSMSKYWMKVNKYFLIVGITFIFTSLKVMQVFRNDIKDGTLLILLSKPISRTRIYLQKFLAIFTMIIIVSVFYLLLTNLPLYLIIKNIDPASPYSKGWRPDNDIDYTSINLPLINNLISDIKANIAYGFLNLIIVLIVSSLFIMLTMVFQNIRLTLFAPLIGMGVIMFNSDSVIMKLILKDEDWRRDISTKYIDNKLATPLVLLNDLKNSGNDGKKTIWKDVKNIAQLARESVNQYKDFDTSRLNEHKKYSNRTRELMLNKKKLEILQNLISNKLNVWKLDFDKLTIDNSFLELFKTNEWDRIIEKNSRIVKLEDKIKDLEKHKQKETQWEINDQIGRLKKELDKLEIDKKDEHDYRRPYNNWENIEKIKVEIHKKIIKVFFVDAKYNKTLNLDENTYPLLNLNNIMSHLSRWDNFRFDLFKSISSVDKNEIEDLLKIEISRLIWHKLFNSNYEKQDLLENVFALTNGDRDINISSENLREYKSRVKTKKWISWLSPLEHLSYILEGYNSNSNIYEYLINPNFNEKDNPKYIDDEMFESNQNSIFEKVTLYDQSRNEYSYYKLNSKNLFNNENSKIKVKYFLNWHIVLSIYIILSIMFFSLALLKFNKTDFS